MLDFYTLAFQFKYPKHLWESIVGYFDQIIGLFSEFKYKDAIDIFFVAIVLYFVIRIIRETRAIQLVKGIIFLAVSYFIVTLMDLGASRYLLKAVFGNILIIVVILFGPEIRNVLEQIGKGASRTSLRTILNSGSAIERKEMQNTIDATCKACVDMSVDKVGALIVFENETQISDIVASGTVLEAKATKELLGNIFFPKAPLHDGAVVIRDAVVYAAGCILPLAHDNTIASELGTRHRAAIGISQHCDGIAVIVSEETGHISYAQNGVLTRNVTSGELREVLTKTFIDESESDGGLLRKIFRRKKKNG